MTNYEEELEVYWEKYDEYWAVENGKELWSDVCDTNVTYTEYVYCYYDGSKVTELGRSTSDWNFKDSAKEKPVIIYQVNAEQTETKLRLSELYSVELAEVDVRDMLCDVEQVTRIAMKENIQELEPITGRYNVHNDGVRMSYIDDKELTQREIKDGKLQAPVVYDTDVTFYWFTSQKKNRIYYMKDYDRESETGTLYYNKEKLDDDVYCDYGLSETGLYVPKYKNGCFYYMQDYDDYKEEGTFTVCKGGSIKEIDEDVYMNDINITFKDVYYVTEYNWDNYEKILNIWNGKEKEEVAEDIYDYVCFENGDVYYLQDFNWDENEGTLYYYQNDKHIEIDDDVSQILHQDKMTIQ